MSDDRAQLRRLHRAPEQEVVAPLLETATLPNEVAARVDVRARALVRAARRAHRPGADVTDFLRAYGLGTTEGVALLCLAEALLRIPDAATADALKTLATIAPRTAFRMPSFYRRVISS